MSCFSLILAAILGAILLGPIGAFLFPAVLALFGPREKKRTFRGGSKRRINLDPRTLPQVLVLLAAMMKADGKVMRSELAYVRHFLEVNYGSRLAKEALQMLRDLLRRDLPVDSACVDLKGMMSFGMRKQILRALMELAQVDGQVTVSERDLLQKVATLLGVVPEEYSRMHNRYAPPMPDYYAVLGISRGATNEEVRQAYRKLAIQWHPDRMHDRTEEEKKQANARLQQINEAYDKIKSQRGMK